MKLLIRRDRRSGILGKVIFQLDVRAQLSDDERKHIDKYRLGKEILYSKNEAPISILRRLSASSLGLHFEKPLKRRASGCSSQAKPGS